MRVGINPQRDQELNNKDKYFHQIIIPVYIPNLEGYYKDSFEIFKLHINSILKTIHKKTYISIVANGCCAVVEEYIINLKHKNFIQEAIITQPIGKINSILKAVVGNNFKFITITDADVLFLNDWQNAVYDVFNWFPKTGYVSTTPTPKTFNFLTGNIWFHNFLNNKIDYMDIPDVEAVKRFASSIGNENLYENEYLKKILVIKSKQGNAVLGGGHFTGTYRGDIFNSLHNTNSNFSLGGNSVGIFLDEPVLKYDMWRLSTYKNYSYHLGNVLENWMFESVDNLFENNIETSFNFSFKKKAKKVNPIKLFFYRKFVSKKLIKLYFLIHNKLNFYKF